LRCGKRPKRCTTSRCLCEAREQAHRLVLHRDALGMFERQVDEGALLGRERFVLARAHHRGRGAQRARITGERARRVAQGVAGELVEQQDVGERAVRLGCPADELAAQRTFDQRGETLGDVAVGRRALLEPHRAQRATLGVAFGREPEVDDRLRIGIDQGVPPSWRHR
jgi:hypothetical protein